MRFDKIFIIIIVAAFFAILGRQLVIDVNSTLELLTRLVALQSVAVRLSTSTGNEVNDYYFHHFGTSKGLSVGLS